MLAKVWSCAVIGLDGALVEVEVDIGAGLPAFNIVGLPDTAVQESRERVRSAIKHSGAAFPTQRITVNLAPADLRKAGPAYDLPIAIGILLASGQLQAAVDTALFIGELALDGTLRHLDGVLPMVSIGKSAGLTTVFVPAVDGAEAALIAGISVIPAVSLGAVLRHLAGQEPLAPQEPPRHESGQIDYPVDIGDVKGHEHAKRALEIAAAGGHNVLLHGPPGSGKTMLARCLPTILPPLTPDEALEVAKIYSVKGLLPPATPLMRQRPFRAPHHTISNAGLIGGGRLPHPGEVSLAHRGVLFLDEIAEFNPQVLQVLRQPLEDQVVTISRAAGTLLFPASLMLIGAYNPCPCGHFGEDARRCTCSSTAIARYQKRLSGPLLDRIDIHVEVPRLDYDKLAQRQPGEPSARIRERVTRARQVQAERLGDPGRTNALMSAGEVRRWCELQESGQTLMRTATRQLSLSARSFHRVLKLARTIADLAGSRQIEAYHLAEAFQYRPRGHD